VSFVQYAAIHNPNCCSNASDPFGKQVADRQIWSHAQARDLEGLLLRRWPQIAGLLVEADLIEVHQDSLEAFRHGTG
jgi:hypothetical protein